MPLRTHSDLVGWRVCAAAICTWFALVAVASGESDPAPLFDATKARSAEETAAAQKGWAAALKAGVERENSAGMKLRLIPPGEYRRGSTAEEITEVLALDETFKKDDGGDEMPAHVVKITRPFYLGATEVTRGQFRKFVTAEKYVTEPERDGKGSLGFHASSGRFEEDRKKAYTWKSTGFPQTDSHPAVNVTWNDALAFCKWLSAADGLEYRLPTEAEWEYACRAGTVTRYQPGDDPDLLAKYGNVADGTALAKFSTWKGISAKDGVVFTAPVGKYRPNAFGLFDMHGNACEWCSDWYSYTAYAAFAKTPAVDPTGPAKGTDHLVRGGSWNNSPAFCRSTSRRRYPPDERFFFLGFRVAATVKD